MNKIIVVGHPQSGLDKVQELLLACGMAQALPSRREGFTPEQIGATLLKAHGAVPVQQVREVDELQQIAVAPVWQGLALDLMLANMEQPLWGWADAQAIYLLDYWKAQDPQTMFVLVYDTPETALTRHAVEHLETEPEALQSKVNAWVAYNSALLGFHLRNPSRSVLVHAGQVQASAKNTLQHISAHIAAPLQLPFGLQAAEASHAEQEATEQTDAIERLTAQLQAMQGSQFKKARKRLRGQLQALQTAAAMPAKTKAAALNHSEELSAGPLISVKSGVLEQESLDNDALAKLLAQQLLQAHPQAQQLYEELQAAATLAYGMDARSSNATVPALSSESNLAPCQAWQSLVKQRQHLQMQTRLTKAQAEQIQHLQQLMQEGEDAAQQKQLHLQTQLQEVQQSLESHQQLTQQQKQAAEEESLMLQKQLHNVREELKSSNLQAQQQERTLAELPKVKTDLQVALGKAAALKEVEQENQLLLTQLHKVQEELENRYLQAQQQEKTLAELPKVKADLKIAQDKANTLQVIAQEKQKLQDQLQKVQEDLTKRLAQSQQQEKALAELSKVKVELQAAQETAKKMQSYQAQANQLQAELKAAQDKALQLQQSEAKLKKELQAECAKKPAADLQKENELLLIQLHKVQEELERHFLENNKLKAELKPQAPALFGAADSVKQQLPYRLGAVMIKQSRSIGGWLNMPFALRAEAKRYTQDQAVNTSSELSPITQYRDAHEAELVKKHLSYRLGACLITNTQTLGGRICLPWSLYTEVKAFKKERQSH